MTPVLIALAFAAVVYFTWRGSGVWYKLAGVIPLAGVEGEYQLTVLRKKRSPWPWRDDSVTMFFAFTKYGDVVVDEYGRRFGLALENALGALFKSWEFRTRRDKGAES